MDFSDDSSSISSEGGIVHDHWLGPDPHAPHRVHPDEVPHRPDDADTLIRVAGREQWFPETLLNLSEANRENLSEEVVDYLMATSKSMINPELPEVVARLVRARLGTSNYRLKPSAQLWYRALDQQLRGSPATVNFVLVEVYRCFALGCIPDGLRARLRASEREWYLDEDIEFDGDHPVGPDGILGTAVPWVPRRRRNVSSRQHRFPRRLIHSQVGQTQDGASIFQTFHVYYPANEQRIEALRQQQVDLQLADGDIVVGVAQPAVAQHRAAEPGFGTHGLARAGAPARSYPFSYRSSGLHSQGSSHRAQLDHVLSS
ncbi:hypothetical protein NKR23_g10826 [Pleurostoma richardsiae]|uniref:Uncharacterized protein n=1 Tax=Pleurostoma richardsiae TaxID=41990 RepID=A0AA38VKX3_9PEZI|nr:hypothetical protein NKR23_g10826 [Pleurostoma richardsiae]